MKEGSFHTEEAKNKISNSLKGRAVWNKGLLGWNMGHIISEETRRKIGLANKIANEGNHSSLKTEFKIGQTSPRKGIKLSKELREKLSIAHKGQVCWCKGLPPERQPNWKGGISKDYKHYRQRRISLMRQGGELSIKTIQLIYEDNIKQYGTLTCYLCLKPIPFGKDNLEHKTPLCRNGTNEYNNLAIACKSCNCKKHKKTEKEYKNILI